MGTSCRADCRGYPGDAWRRRRQAIQRSRSRTVGPLPATDGHASAPAERGAALSAVDPVDASGPGAAEQPSPGAVSEQAHTTALGEKRGWQAGHWQARARRAIGEKWQKIPFT